MLFFSQNISTYCDQSSASSTPTGDWTQGSTYASKCSLTHLQPLLNEGLRLAGRLSEAMQCPLPALCCPF